MIKLFYWNDVTTLSQDTNGNVFALAETKEQAVQLIFEKYRKEMIKEEDTEWSKDYEEKILNHLKIELQETNPLIIENPEGFFIIGSA